MHLQRNSRTYHSSFAMYSTPSGAIGPSTAPYARQHVTTTSYTLAPHSQITVHEPPSSSASSSTLQGTEYRTKPERLTDLSTEHLPSHSHSNDQRTQLQRRNEERKFKSPHIAQHLLLPLAPLRPFLPTRRQHSKHPQPRLLPMPANVHPSSSTQSPPSSSSARSLRTLIFSAPYEVEVIRNPPLSSPPPNHVLVKGVVSAVSHGTEMLLYRGLMPKDFLGDFDQDGGKRRALTYPTSYGYAHVGVIEQVGDAVKPAVAGTRVFAFREHTSHYIDKLEHLILIPNNISDFDAAFLPSVETAIAIISDAKPLMGEAVCVIGQGIVGLLVCRLLREYYPWSRVLTVEAVTRRRQLSVKHAGADASISPQEAVLGSEVVVRALGTDRGADIVIEVSGQGSGFNTAIDMCRDYGKIVLASWYGTKDVVLTELGGRFHRSHIKIVATQVSQIPAELSGRWSKERRFNLAWDSIAKIRPSTLFGVDAVHVADFNDAPQAYNEIDSRQHLQVLLKY